MLTEEQVAARINYLGGSEAAAVLGLSRWSTPLRVWAEKTSQLPPPDLADNQAVEMGNELEETVCRIFTKRTGKKVQRVNETRFHPTYPFLAANLDRIVVGEDAILEAKTCSAWRAKEFEGEELPPEFILQVMHYLAVTGKNIGYVAVLIGGQDFRWKMIQRDDKLIADMLKREVAFWRDFVEKKVMPLQITKNDGPTLYSLFPLGDESEEIELGDEANRLIESRSALLSDKKVCEGQLDLVDNEIKALLKDKAAGVTDKYRVTWKSQIQRRLDAKALQEKRPEIAAEFTKPIGMRVLRVTELKK